METFVSITATELKQNLGRYLDKAVSGTPVMVSKHGGSRVKIIPCRADGSEAAGERGFSEEGAAPEPAFASETTREPESVQVSEMARQYHADPEVMTYQAFMDMYEATEERMEFLNGEVYLLASPTVFHQDVVRNLLVSFAGWLKGKPCKAFVSPFDVHFHKKGIDCPDVCQPDVLIACDTAGNINEKGKYMGTPALVVEILSPSTRSKDMVTKLNTYMLSGVKEFWVVDPGSRTILAYMFKDFEIESYFSCKDGETVASLAFPGMEVSVADIFME